MSEKIRNNYENYNEKNDIKKFKDSLTWLNKELLKNLDNKWEIVQINKEFNNILRQINKEDKLNLDFQNKLLQIQKKLYSPEIKNNNIAKVILEIINFISELSFEIPEKDINKISNILDNPNIPSLLKKQFADFLKNHYLPHIKGTKYVEITNNLTLKYPKYNLDNSVLVPDPEWWYVYTNNL